MLEVPFREHGQLNVQLLQVGRARLRRANSQDSDTFPARPCIRLANSVALQEYLAADLLVPQLDRLAPKLWLVSSVYAHLGNSFGDTDIKVATPRSSHISALHHQAVRGRKVVLTEFPHLHLVWYYDRVFIKPLPGYLLSHAFWQFLQAQDPSLYLAALGFMRTYSYLVRSKTDLT